MPVYPTRRVVTAKDLNPITQKGLSALKERRQELEQKVEKLIKSKKDEGDTKRKAPGESCDGDPRSDEIKLCCTQISDIDKKLRGATALPEGRAGGEKQRVTIGCSVKLFLHQKGEELVGRIADSEEIINRKDPKEILISCYSPVGRAILGWRVGSTVGYLDPNGIDCKVTILEVF